MNKLYMVTGDTCDGFGCQLYSFGVFTNLERAEEIAKQMENIHRCICTITRLTVDEHDYRFLGGYIE